MWINHDVLQCFMDCSRLRFLQLLRHFFDRPAFHGTQLSQHLSCLWIHIVIVVILHIIEISLLFHKIFRPVLVLVLVLNLIDALLIVMDNAS